MKSIFKNFLALLAVAISVFCYAQTPTLIASGTYKANGNGTSGIPTVSINIPAGKNRLMIISTFSERIHDPYESNFVANSDAESSHNISVNGISAQWLSAPWTDKAANKKNTTFFSTLNTVRYISDAMGMPSGVATITFPGINLPKNSGDEMIVQIAIFENAKSNPTLLDWGHVRNFDTATSFLTLSGTTPTIPVGNSINNLVFFGTGGISQQKNVEFSSGWTTIQTDVMNNTNGTSSYLSSMSPNEHDGIGYTTAYTTISSGDPSFTLSRSATNLSTEAASANLISILPMARPSVSGTVYIDNNGTTGGINNGGTGGGTWSTANALYVNAIDTNGNVVATALVNTSGIFTFAEGGALIEGDVIKFQLSKTQGTVGQPAPAKDLPVGWGTVGESIASSTSDGTINGEFTLTIGTANSPNNTTNLFGVTACAAGTVAPTVENLFINCPATFVNLDTAHTGTVPASTSLVWFTNNTHTGTALSGTQITQAGAGTYYAFYYDSTKICYSPAATVIITANTTDSDGDGYLDTCDLDDDNDGILDSSECQSSDRISNGVFPTSGSLTGWTTSGSYSLTSRGLEFTADNSTITTVSQSLTGIFGNSNIYVNDINWLTTNTSGATSTLVTEFLYNGTVYATIDTGTGVAGSIPTVRGNNGAVTNISTLPSIGSTGTWSTTNTDLIITLPPNIPSSSGTFQIRFRAGTSGNSVDDISIRSVQLISCSDFDGDGIPNQLDLDSDGDGCPDAVEGSDNFNPTATASGTLSTQTPNINFGTTVDANGVPTEVGASGQAIGQSIDASKNDCLDTDGDGYPDWQDLDDDNDGILDCVENGLNTTIDKIFKANNNATYIASPSTGPVHQYRLTNGKSENGQVWSYGKVDFTKSFSLPMKALLSDADGIAIVFHNSPAGQLAGGTNGQGLGARGIANGIALELDTFENGCANDANNGGNCDPGDDHGSIRTTAGWVGTGKLAGDTKLGDGSVDDLVWHNVVINWNAATRNLSYTFDGVPVTNYTFPTTGANAIETILGGNSAYFGYTASTGGYGSTNSVGFDDLCALPLTLDFDNDGIPNHLDLDSDGDGCSDAREGAGNFNPTTTASGTISTQNPNQNFGIDVDSNGVPTLAGASGQGVGQSQDIGKNDCIDSDGDGYPDWQDLDDDNDGILDTVECSVTDLVTNGTFTGNANGWTLENSWTYNTNRVANSADGETSRLLQSISNLNKLSGNIIPLTFTVGAQDASNASGNTSALEIRLNGALYATINNATSRDNSNVTITLEPGVMSNFTTFGTSAVNGYTTQTFTLWIPYTGPSTANLVFRKVGGNDDWSIDNVSIPAMICDTDGDGILDHLDLDSDGDGCPDAIEGSENFTSASLFNSLMSGGNTGGSYIGTAGPVSNNLGNTVGNTPTTMGVPNIAGTGQGVGGSRIATNYSQCLDSDGDGYPDWQDLDDDNDGILDTVEMCKSAISTDFFGDNTHTVTIGSSANVVPTTITITPAITDYFIGWHMGNATTAVGKEMSINFSNPVYFANDDIDFSLGGMDANSKFGNFFVVYEDGTSQSNLNLSLANISPANGILLSSTNGANSIETIGAQASANLTLLAIDRTKRVVKVGYTVHALNGGAYSENIRPRIQIDCDMDSDGIPNHLDLDSDGDGCPDALEGDENVISSQLNGNGSINSTVDANGVPTVVNSSGAADVGGDQGQGVGDAQNASVKSQCSSTFCYKPGILDAGNTYPTKHGITALGRAGAENDNWPMVRQSAWTVLEAKTKGFVVNRVKFNTSNQPVADNGTTLVITNPVEGMMVYDTTNNCLKVYTTTDGTTFAWHCMSTQACPQ